MRLRGSESSSVIIILCLVGCLYRVQYLHSREVLDQAGDRGPLEGRIGSSSSSPPPEVGAGRGVPGGGLGGVHVGLLLGLPDVPLVADPLVTEPVAHLEQSINQSSMNQHSTMNQFKSAMNQ